MYVIIVTNIEESVDSTSVNTKGKPSEGIIKLLYCNHDHRCFVFTYIILATVTSVEEVEDEVVINVNEKPSEGRYCHQVTILQP